MTEVLGQAAGIRVELDVERLGVVISKQVAEQLAGLFPSEASPARTRTSAPTSRMSYPV
jgi:hypothetical protein